eukprot:2453308-Pleurochrysis_carterae.AAC.1
MLKAVGARTRSAHTPQIDYVNLEACSAGLNSFGKKPCSTSSEGYNLSTADRPQELSAKKTAGAVKNG